MLDYLEIKIERWAFAEHNRAHEMHVTCVFNGQEYRTQKIFQPTEIESYFSQTWEHMGREIAAHIKADQRSVQTNVCPSCGASYVAPESQYCHACGTRRTASRPPS